MKSRKQKAEGRNRPGTPPSGRSTSEEAATRDEVLLTLLIAALTLATLWWAGWILFGQH